MSPEPEKRSDEDTWALLAEAATPGPWHWENNHRELHGIGGDENYTYEDDVLLVEHDGGCACRQACTMTVEIKDADRDFIAAARTAVPALLAALAASRADNERLTEQIDRIMTLDADDEPNEADLAIGAEWWARTCIWWAKVCRQAWAERDAARVEVSQLRAKIERVEALIPGIEVSGLRGLLRDLRAALAAEPLGSTPDPCDDCESNGRNCINHDRPSTTPDQPADQS